MGSSSSHFRLHRRRIRPLLKRLVVHALYWTGILWIYAIVKLRGRGIALMYHRVLPFERSCNSHSTAAIQVTTETFERHVRFLKRHFKPLSASQLVEHLASERQLPNRSVLITFDDGWHDNAGYATPVLERHDVPAVIFIATDYVGQLGGFWQERLARLLHIAHRYGLLRQATFEDPRFSIEDGLDDYEVRLAIRGIVDDIKLNEPAAALGILEEIRQFLTNTVPGEELDDCGDDRFLSWEELLRLRESSLVEFGSHACSHTPLTQLTKVNVSEELQRSKSILEARLSQPIRCFAYPNGDFSETIATQVQSAGYVLAFTTKYGLIGPDQPPHTLGRVSIHEVAADSHPMLLARILGII